MVNVTQFTSQLTSLNKPLEKTLIQITFDQSVSNFDFTTLLNGQAGTFTNTAPSLQNKVWEADFLPLQNVNNGAVSLSIPSLYEVVSGVPRTINLTFDSAFPTVVEFTVENINFPSRIHKVYANETALVTLEFSEAVNSVFSMNPSPDGDYTLTTEDNIHWTGTFTPKINHYNSSSELTVKRYKDFFGNDASPDLTESNSFTVDTRVLSVSSFTVESSNTTNEYLMNSLDTATVTLVFSEAVPRNFDSGSCISVSSVPNGVVAGSVRQMTSTDNITWIGQFIASPDILYTQVYIDLATNYSDSRGNTTSPSARTSTDFFVSTLKPQATTFTISKNPLSKADLTTGATVTIVFNKAVIGFDSDSDITFDPLLGTLDTMSSSDNTNITWTGTFKPANDFESKTCTLTLNTSYTDAYDNPGITRSLGPFEIDTKAPDPVTVNWPTVANTKTNQTVFSGSKTGTDAVQWEVSHTGGNSDPTYYTTSRTTFTSDQFSLPALNPGLYAAGTLHVISIDAVGNSSSDFTNPVDFEINTTAPEVISSSFERARTTMPNGNALNDTLIIGDTATVSLEFSKAVTLASLDIQQANSSYGTLTTMTTTDGGINWTGTYTPANDILVTDPLYSLKLKNTFMDLFGNTGTAKPDTVIKGPISINTKIPPTISAIWPTKAKTNQNTIQLSTPLPSTIYSWQYSTTYGTWEAFRPDSTTSFDLLDRRYLNNSISLRGFDSDGNVSAETKNNPEFELDTDLPQYTLFEVQNDRTVMYDGTPNANPPLIIGDTATVTIEFDKPVESISVSIEQTAIPADFWTPSNDNKTWTGTQYVIPGSVEKTGNELIMTSFKDFFGNDGASTPVLSNKFDVDTIAPAAVTVADWPPAYSNDTQIPVTLPSDVKKWQYSFDNTTWSTSIFTPSTVSHITLPNTNKVYEANSVGLRGFDKDGNVSVVTKNNTLFEVNYTAPTVVMTLVNNRTNDPALTSTLIKADKAALTLEFSKPDITNVQVAYNTSFGELSVLVRSNNGRIWTGTFEPVNGMDYRRVEFTLSDNYEDKFGNRGQGDNISGYVDTKSPTVVRFVMDKSLILMGEVSNVEIEFSEPVDRFNSDVDIVAPNGILSHMTTASSGVGSKTIWRGVFTPTQNIVDTINIMTLSEDYYDLYGNRGMPVVPPTIPVYGILPDIICFREGTTFITCLDPETKEDYECAVELMKPGMFVKTYKHGYIQVEKLAYKTIQNPASAERTKNRLYQCARSKYPELYQDLFITGCHAILESKITEEQVEQIREALGLLFFTDDKYRLIAMCDDRAEPYCEEGDFKVWHVCLEHYDDEMNYGIYANGLLVESCCKRNVVWSDYDYIV